MSRVPSPWFATAPHAGARGRLLLATYHFPPSRAVGGLRWQKLAGIAAARGWELDVIALEPSALPLRDDARLDDLPPGVRVFGVPEGRSLAQRIEAPLFAAVASARQLRQRLSPRPTGDAPQQEPDSRDVRAETYLPRAEIRFEPLEPRGYIRAFNAWVYTSTQTAWADGAERLGAALLSSGVRYHAVISAGPPHLVHKAMSRLAARARLPHVIDMRDPWSLQQRLAEGIATPLWFRMNAAAERQALDRAALLVCNTPAFLQSMEAAFPDAPARRISILNGWDDEVVPQPGTREQFLVAYAGTIYLDRDPRPLFQAAQRLVEGRRLDPSRFAIELMGEVRTFEGQTLEAIATGFGLGPFVRTRPTGSRRETFELYSRAAVLVSLPQDSDLAIPSKIFEYMLFPAWTLALAVQGSATATLLENTGAAVIAPHDIDGIAGALDRWYEAFSRGALPDPIAQDDRFSRRRQGAQLFEAIEGILAP